MKDLHDIASRARKSFYCISVSSSAQRNDVLYSLVRLLKENKEAIFAANRTDIEAAKNSALASPLLHRLTFGEEKLNQMVLGLQALAQMQDPINRTLVSTEIAESLRLYRCCRCHL